MTAQGPELRALADTLREAGQSGPRVPNGIRLPDGSSPVLIWVTPDNLSTIISALERAAAAEGEKAEACAWCCQASDEPGPEHSAHCPSWMSS